MAPDSHVTDPPSTTALKLWRADEAAMRPVLVECPKGRDGNDADGVEIFSNTHYEDEGDAWEHLIASSIAGSKITGGNVTRIRADLRAAEIQSRRPASKQKAAQTRLLAAANACRVEFLARGFGGIKFTRLYESRKPLTHCTERTCS